MCGWTDLRITKTLQTRWKIIFFFLRYNLNTLKVSTDAIWAQKNKLEQIVKSHHCSLNHRVKFQTVWNDSFIFKTLTNIGFHLSVIETIESQVWIVECNQHLLLLLLLLHAYLHCYYLYTLQRDLTNQLDNCGPFKPVEHFQNRWRDHPSSDRHLERDNGA